MAEIGERTEKAYRGEDSPERPASELEQSFNETDMVLEELGNIIHRLEIKLEPVMLPAEPSVNAKDAGDAVKARPESMVLSSINRQRRALVNQLHRLESIRDRVQL